jgi:HD-GYP domain-containing protein (c-di-GMP phosphodiesterase class II)
MAGRALTRLRGLFGAQGGATPNAGTSRSLPAALREELVAALPPGERLRTWTARHGAADEMPRARQAFARAEKTLAGLFDEIRNGAPPRLDRVEVAARHLADSMIDNPDALPWVAQRREEPLQAHQQGVRVGLYMIALARRLGLPRDPMARAAMVGMLADVGKSRLPRALLEKPGMLNPAEYGIVKEHVRLGLEMLAEGGNPGEDVMLGIAQHHERLDGSGYPKGLREGEIGLFGRMAAIADSYAGLTTPRAYASPLAPQDALMNLLQWAGSSFDPGLVEQFVQAIGVFPVGSLVELSGGEVAVVREQNPGHPLQPRVRLLTWPDRRPLAVPIEADLHRPSGGDRGSAPAPGRIVRGLPSGSARVSRGPAGEEGPGAR